MLADIIKHLTPDRLFEEYYAKLHAIMIKLLNSIDDFPALFAMVCSFSEKKFDRSLRIAFSFLSRRKCCPFWIYFNVKMFESIYLNRFFKHLSISLFDHSFLTFWIRFLFFNLKKFSGKNQRSRVDFSIITLC